MNQDAVLSERYPFGQLYAVADGMGGHAAGDLAARLALERFQAALSDERLPVVQRLIYAAEAANRAILEEATGTRAGMGTTLVAALVQGSSVLITHIGDSRAYLLRGGTLYRLTDDHSWVMEQVRLGHLSPEEAQHHRWRNVVSNALGGEERVRLELFGLELQRGDRLLLCSDGLYTTMSDEKLLNVLGLPQRPHRTAQTLVDLANQAGGPDNVSVVVVDVVSDLPSPGGPLPPRRAEGPLDTRQLLSELNQGRPLHYAILVALYLVLMTLVLFPLIRVYVVAAGLMVLVLLFRRRDLQLEAGLPVLRDEAAVSLPPEEPWPGPESMPGGAGRLH